ncbi:hypothetical protein VTN31DRAFT_1706 [Thermomyces dupontii]|uniref:uncharacterized protein n=1 Tax=Talaromyces thermophilus TaxID=28565 RepID=UPI003743E0BA
MQKILANICPAPNQPSSDPGPQLPNELLHNLSTQHLQSNAQNGHGDDASTETTTAAGGFPTSSIFADPHDSAAEMLRLRRELMAANSRIAQQEQELAETRNIKHTLDQALGSPSEADFGGREVSDHTISSLQNALNAASVRPFNHRQEPWTGDDAQSDISDALSAGAYNRSRAHWVPMLQSPFVPQRADRGYQEPMNMWSPTVVSSSLPPQGPAQPHRMFSGPSSGAPSLDGRYMNEQNAQLGGPSFPPRRSVSNIGRGTPCFGPPAANWGAFGGVIPGGTASKPLNTALNAYQQIGMHPIPQYQPRPIGTPLSPTAAEFTANSANGSAWIIPSAVCIIRIPFM